MNVWIDMSNGKTLTVTFQNRKEPCIVKIKKQELFKLN